MALKNGKIEKDIEVFSLHPQRKRCLVATSLDKIFTWLDVSYAVHHDMKSHTEVFMYMGSGVTNCRSSKKNLNTKSSTGAELVGASDYLPYNICYVVFMHHQGYLNKSSRFSQDNKSAIKTEVNGRNSYTVNSDLRMR